MYVEPKRTYEPITNIPELKENEIYISHVGDGEYSFNVFGSAHKNLNKFLNFLLQDNHYVTDKEELILEQFDTGFGYNIGYITEYEDFRTKEKRTKFRQLAYLTIETIDPDKFPTG